MTSMPVRSSPVRPDAPAILREPRLALGAAALFVWFIALTATDIAHTALMAAQGDDPANTAAYAVYEIASGYVLGFVAAIAAAMLGGLLRGSSLEMVGDVPWLRHLMVFALFVVVLACVAGAAVHNADGVTVLYDLAFAIGLVVVFAGLVPLHQHLLGRSGD